MGKVQQKQQQNYLTEDEKFPELTRESKGKIESIYWQNVFRYPSKNLEKYEDRISMLGISATRYYWLNKQCRVRNEQRSGEAWQKYLREKKEARSKEWEIPPWIEITDPVRFRKYVERVIIPEKIGELKKTNKNLPDDYFDVMKLDI